MDGGGQEAEDAGGTTDDPRGWDSKAPRNCSKAHLEQNNFISEFKAEVGPLCALLAGRSEEVLQKDDVQSSGFVAIASNVKPYDLTLLGLSLG